MLVSLKAEVKPPPSVPSFCDARDPNSAAPHPMSTGGGSGVPGEVPGGGWAGQGSRSGVSSCRDTGQHLGWDGDPQPYPGSSGPLQTPSVPCWLRKEFPGDNRLLITPDSHSAQKIPQNLVGHPASAWPTQPRPPLAQSSLQFWQKHQLLASIQIYIKIHINKFT